MKYILFILLLFSFSVNAQKTKSIFRIIEKTGLSFDSQAEEFLFDTVPVPMNTFNSKIIFRDDQLLIIDDDTTFITLGPSSSPLEDSSSVSMEWAEAEYNGNAYRVYLYTENEQQYDKLVVIDQEENIGYLYLLSLLKMDVIPTASSISTNAKKKSK